LNNLFYRAYNTQTHRMYDVVGIRWSAAIPGQIDSMELVNPIDRAYRVVYRDPTFEQFILMPAIPYYDKNDTLIYEGDIVATGHTQKHVKSVVRIGPSETYADAFDHAITRPYYGVYLEGTVDLEEYLLKGEMYVLGNIYQHPHLLIASEEREP
jgi:uncharacterized phage protein (TIGR01671 family)